MMDRWTDRQIQTGGKGGKRVKERERERERGRLGRERERETEKQIQLNLGMFFSITFKNLA